MTTEHDPPIQAVREAVERALSEDLGPVGDVTAALLPEAAQVAATLVARASGVLAGTACARETYTQLDKRVETTWSIDDGDAVEPGTEIGTIAGPLRSVLTGERTALNFLCHLSGVATLTRRFVQAVAGRAQIWDTRKTLPGLRALEKAAVAAGGGTNHRMGLYDAILIKDNHAALAGGVGEAVRRARESGGGLEVEVDGGGVRVGSVGRGPASLPPIQVLGVIVTLAFLGIFIVMPLIIVFCVTGAYSLKNSLFDVGTMLVFGVAGYVLRKLEYPLAPLVLAPAPLRAAASAHATHPASGRRRKFAETYGGSRPGLNRLSRRRSPEKVRCRLTRQKTSRVVPKRTGSVNVFSFPPDSSGSHRPVGLPAQTLVD